jgi:hypothetical protein
VLNVAYSITGLATLRWPELARYLALTAAITTSIPDVFIHGIENPLYVKILVPGIGMNQAEDSSGGLRPGERRLEQEVYPRS